MFISVFVRTANNNDDSNSSFKRETITIKERGWETKDINIMVRWNIEVECVDEDDSII